VLSSRERPSPQPALHPDSLANGSLDIN